MALALLEDAPTVIGLTGPANSGKDTMADYLVSAWGFKKVSFAGPIKRAVVELYGLESTSFDDRSTKEARNPHWGQSPREMAQWIGTEVMRDQVDKDFFLRRMDLNMTTNGEERAKVVISDVRFDNEAQYIRDKWHGQVWKPDTGARLHGAANGGMSAKAKNHSSEKGISPHLIDRDIDNSGSLATAYEQIDYHLLGIDTF